jgi:CubicO group peptidase (beta-lactamase class C family)
MSAKSFSIAAALTTTCLFTSSAHADTPMDPVLARWDHDEHPDLRGVVILHKGRRLAERYYNGANPGAIHDMRSAGKSITALLVGIATEQGAIRSLDDPISRYWPEASGSAIGAVALRDVLTMRSGLAAFDEDPASPGNEDRMDVAPDPLTFVRQVPDADPPGMRYRYNSVTAYVAGLVVARATGRHMSDFARQFLFQPLGIRRLHWDSDAAGLTKGQGNLSMTTREMATIGEMVRNRGRWGHRQVVGASWIAEMLAPRVSISADDPYADHYGYFWYQKDQPIGGTVLGVSFASGNGGNKIYVVPDCALVVAITSSAYGHGYGQRRSESILKAVLAEAVGQGECSVNGEPKAS